MPTHANTNDFNLSNIHNDDPQSTCTLPVCLGNLETTTNKSLIFDLPH